MTIHRKENAPKMPMQNVGAVAFDDSFYFELVFLSLKKSKVTSFSEPLEPRLRLDRSNPFCRPPDIFWLKVDNNKGSRKNKQQTT